MPDRDGQEFDYEQDARLIAEFADLPDIREKFVDFFDYNDVGIPLAQLITLGQIEQLSTDGENSLQETYQNLCDLFSKDSSQDFESIQDLMA